MANSLLRDPLAGIPSGVNKANFPSPWNDIASKYMPADFRTALEVAEFLFMSNGTYRAAQERIIAYFLTDIELLPPDNDRVLGTDERDNWQNFLTDTIDILGSLWQINLDASCYGNGFASLNVPFIRFLRSEKTDDLYSFAEMRRNENVFRLKYEYGRNKFTAVDPKVGTRVDWKIWDAIGNVDEGLTIKHWSPHEIEIIHDLYSGRNWYAWKIPAEYKRDIQSGNLYVLEQAPKKVLEAVHQNGWYLFADEAMYHMRTPMPTGVKNNGWGLAKSFINFRDIFHVQVLRRYNEAVAMDYIVPLRVITPAAKTVSGSLTGGVPDPLQTTDMATARRQLMKMVENRRYNPTSWNVLPFPVEYQLMGGEANQLAPHELIAQAEDTMLNSAGVWQDLYRGTLTMQVFPAALRLFESAHRIVPQQSNQFMRWVIDQVSRLTMFPAVRARLRRVTQADDANKQMIALQLHAAQQLSGTTALGNLGFDHKHEQRLIQEEASDAAKQQMRMQEEMQQAAFGQEIAKGQMPGAAPNAPPGAAPAGGAPAGAPQDPNAAAGAAQGAPMAPGMSLIDQVPPVGVNISMDELEMLGQSIAAELIVMPETQRLGLLRQLKQKNPTVHSIVRQSMEQQRTQARSQGQAMVLGQQGAAPAM